ILMKKKMDLFEPSPYFAWVVHLDGMRERHDQFVEREGTFDKAVDAIHEAKRRGFRVNTNTTFLNTDSPKTVRDVLDFLNDELQVDQMMLSPAYAYEKAPDQEHFPGVRQARKLFETTDWSKYGRGRDPRCDNCMAHCGYEPTAVLAATKSLRQALRAMVAG